MPHNRGKDEERQLGRVVGAERNANRPNISRRLDPKLADVYRASRDVTTDQGQKGNKGDKGV